MNDEQKYYTYAIYDGKRKVYIGKTNNLQKTIYKHERNRTKFTRYEKTSRAMNKESVLRREYDQLERYRYGHNGENPRDNKTKIDDKNK